MLQQFLLLFQESFLWVVRSTQSTLLSKTDKTNRINLMSLPTEMLVNILKYVKFNEVRRLRKLNTCIDTIAKNYDIGVRVPVWRLCVWPKGSDQKDWVLQYITDGLNIHEITYQQLRLPFYEPLADLLKRIKPIAIVHFAHGNATFDDEFVDFLVTNQKLIRQVKSFFFGTTVTCSLEKLQNVITSWKHFNSIVITLKKKDAFSKIELTKLKKWKSLRIFCFDAPQQQVVFKNDFLVEVVQNCSEFSVTSGMGISHIVSIDEIIHVFKSAFRDGVKPNWNFHVVDSKSLSMSKVDEKFTNIPGCKIDIKGEAELGTRRKLLKYTVYTTNVRNPFLVVTFDERGD